MRIAIAEHGPPASASEHAERLHEALEDRHPEIEALVEANLGQNQLEATFALEASDVKDATGRAIEIIEEAATRAELGDPLVTQMETYLMSSTVPRALRRERHRRESRLRRAVLWPMLVVAGTGIVFLRWPPELFALVFAAPLALLMVHAFFTTGRGARWLAARARRRDKAALIRDIGRRTAADHAEALRILAEHNPPTAPRR